MKDEEKEFINKNYDRMTIADLAKRLKRSDNTIRNYYKKMGYSSRSFLSNASKTWIDENYTYKSMEAILKRLKITQEQLYQHFFDNPDTLDLRKIDTEDILEKGMKAFVKPERLITIYEKHIHQEIEKFSLLGN